MPPANRPPVEAVASRPPAPRHLELFSPGPETALRFLHTAELAERWRLSNNTLERWRCAGVGPAYVKLQGRVLYRQTDIAAYEASHLFVNERTIVAASVANLPHGRDRQADQAANLPLDVK